VVFCFRFFFFFFFFQIDRFYCVNTLKTEVRCLIGGGGVKEKVGGSSAGRANNISGSDVGEGSADLGGVGGGTSQVAEVKGGSSGSMGRGHTGTRDGVGGGSRADPGAQDVASGGEDVHTGTKVGETGPGVSVGGGTDGVSTGGTCRGDVASGLVLVTGSDGEEDASAHGRIDGIVEGGGGGTTEGHVGNSGAATGGIVGGNPVHTIDDTSSGARPTSCEHLNWDDGSELGNTVHSSGGGGADVGSVTITIGGSGITGISDEGGTSGSATGELVVVGVKSSVDNVGINTSTSRGPVLVGGGDSPGPLPDAVNAPKTSSLGSKILGGHGIEGLGVANKGEHLVFLDEVDHGVLQNGVQSGLRGDPSRITVDDGPDGLNSEVVAVAEETVEVSLLQGDGDIVVENNDVRIVDGFAGGTEVEGCAGLDSDNDQKN